MAGQSGDRGSVDTTKGGNPRIGQASEPCPADGTESRCARMAKCRKGGRQEDQRRTSLNGPSKLDRVVGGTGDKPTIRAWRTGPASGTEVDTRIQRGGEGRVSSDHQSETARAADAGEVAAKCGAVGRVIMAEDYAGKASGQAAGG